MSYLPFHNALNHEGYTSLSFKFCLWVKVPVECLTNKRTVFRKTTSVQCFVTVRIYFFFIMKTVFLEKVQNSASICFTIIILHCQIEQCHSNGSYAAKVLTATIIWETRVTFATRLHNFHCCGIVPFGSVKLKRLSVIDSCDRQITGHISWLHSWLDTM